MSSNGGFSSSSSAAAAAHVGNVNRSIIDIFFMRHSKSCSNMMKDFARKSGVFFSNMSNRLVRESQQILDPPLSDQGVQMARDYKDTLNKKLTELGLLNEDTVIGSSELVRAQQTARILFPSVEGNIRKLNILPYLAEEGDIPENTRRDNKEQAAEIRKTLGVKGKVYEVEKSKEYTEPNIGPRQNLRSLEKETGWDLFKGWLERDRPFDQDSMIIVGHGSYLRNVYETIMKQTEPKFELPIDFKLHNMDGFHVRVETTQTGPYTYTIVPIDGAPILRSRMDIPKQRLIDDRCSARTEEFKPLPLREYTTDSKILAYEDQLNNIYKRIMKDSPLLPTTPIALAIGYLQELFKERTTEFISSISPDPILRTMFIKMYSLSTVYNAYIEEAWPPADYPDTAPPLYTIPNYHQESVYNSIMRVLTKIGAKRGLSPKSVFETIRSPTNEGRIRTIGSLLDIDLTAKVWDELQDETGNTGLSLHIKVDPVDRFLNNLLAAKSFEEYELTRRERDFYTDFEEFFKSKGIRTSTLQNRVKDRYQQFYTILPWNARSNYTFQIGQRVNGNLDIHTIPFSSTLWMQFPKDTFRIMPRMTNETTYEGAMIIQGYKLADNPEIVAALTRGPLQDAHPEVKLRFPEWWVSAESRHAWLDSVDLSEKAEALPYNLDYVETMRTPVNILHELDSSEFVDRYAKNPAFKDLREELAILLVDKVSSSIDNKMKTPTTRAEKLSAYADMPQTVKDDVVQKIVVKDIVKIIDNIRSKWIVDDTGQTMISNKIITTLQRLEQLSRDPSMKIDAIQRRLRTWRDLYLSSPNADPALILSVTNFVLDKAPADLRDVTNAVIPILWALKAAELYVDTYDPKILELIPKDLADAALRYIRAIETTEKIFNKTLAENELKLFKSAIKNKVELINIINTKFLKKKADSAANIDPDQEAYNTLVNEEHADNIISEAMFIKTHNGKIKVDNYAENEDTTDVSNMIRKKPTNSFFGNVFGQNEPPHFLIKAEAPDKPILKTIITSRPPYGPPPLAKIRSPKIIEKLAGPPLNSKEEEEDNDDLQVLTADNTFKSALFPTPTVLKGGAYESTDQTYYRKLAEIILRIFYTPKSRQKVKSSIINPQEGEGLSNTLDVLANLADIDPTLVCKKILAEPVEPYTDLKLSLGVKPKVGWFDSMKCPKADGIISGIANYKSSKGLPDLTSNIGKRLERVKAYINNPKATDKKKYEMLQKFETLVKSKLNGAPALPSVQSGWLGKKYPKNKEILSYLDSIQSMLNPLPANVLPANQSRNESFDSAFSKEEYTGPKTGPRDRTGAGKVPFSLYGFSGGRGGSRKTSTITRKMYRSQRRRQSGGGVTMPLGFYQDGAQMQDTYGSETGGGLGGMSSNMAREALIQTGGRQTGGSTFGSRHRQRRRRETRKAQRGGFSPSIMGSFAANGLSLLPVASYMTYRMTHGPKSKSKSKKGSRRTRKSGPVKTGRRRQTRR